MTTPIKHPTAWRPPSGRGSVVVVGMLNLQDNAGNLLIDNLGNNIVTNPSYTTPKHPTVWTQTG